jgi:hypothetical protein
MKIKRLKSYKAFIAAGRPYYPYVNNQTLHLPCFAVNADKSASHHKHCLICQGIVVVNARGFCAVYYEWFSRFGWRHRWYYYRLGERVKWSGLTWDERRKLCLAYMKIDVFAYSGFMLKAPVKNWPEWAAQAVRY